MHCNLLKLIMQVYQLKSKSVDRISHRFGKSQLSSINLYLVLYEATLSNYLFTLILFLSTNRFTYKILFIFFNKSRKLYQLRIFVINWFYTLRHTLMILLTDCDDDSIHLWVSCGMNWSAESVNPRYQIFLPFYQRIRENIFCTYDILLLLLA